MRGELEPRLSELVYAAYDAAIAPRTIDDLLSRLTSAFNASCALLQTCRHPQPLAVCFARGETDAEPTYRQHFHRLHARWAALDEAADVEEFTISLPSGPEPLRVLSSRLGIDPEDRGQDITLSLCRPHRKPPFSPDQHTLMAALLPHFRRALRLRDRLRHAETMTRAAFDTLEQIEDGVILLDGDGKAIHVTHSASALLGQGMTLRDGRLEARSGRETVALRNAVRQALNDPPQASLVAVSGPPSAATLVVCTYPLAAKARVAAGARAVAVVRNPSRRASIAWDTLAERYELTPAELRLFQALADGDRLTDYAARTNISANTARSHMKSVFSKTATHGQGELLALAQMYGTRNGPRRPASLFASAADG